MGLDIKAANRAIPDLASLRGCHAKVFTVLQDPTIRANLRSYVRSNKWCMDPKKLAEFSKNELMPQAAQKYATHILENEMPKGLKKYMEVELFPRIQLKVARGWSLETCRVILHDLGLQYIEHQKGLYYDGHERSDVVDYRQNKFLPQMEKLRPWLAEYVVGDVENKVDKGSVHPLVLVAHDEITAQANDGKKKSWVYEGEQPLRKKGVGRGIHQSDVICSTVGWLKEASQTLEYSKNYEGYWTGELFVKQVRVQPLNTNGRSNLIYQFS